MTSVKDMIEFIKPRSEEIAKKWGISNEKFLDQLESMPYFRLKLIYEAYKSERLERN